MAEITEYDIHLYVLNKTLLNNQTIREIKSRILSDEKFSSEVNEVKEFYEIYNELERVDNKYSLTLKPVYIDKQYNNLKLAAQHNQITDDKLKYISTFASAEKLVMTRLLYNPALKEYELYVLCEEDPNKVRYAVVRFLDSAREFIADNNGIVRIKADSIIEKNIIVNLPIARFEIKPGYLSADEEKKLIHKSDDFEFELFIQVIDQSAECKIEFLSGELSGEIKGYIFYNEDVDHYEVQPIVENKFNFKFREDKLLNIIFVNDSGE